MILFPFCFLLKRKVEMPRENYGYVHASLFLEREARKWQSRFCYIYQN